MVEHRRQRAELALGWAVPEGYCNHLPFTTHGCCDSWSHFILFYSAHHALECLPEVHQLWAGASNSFLAGRPSLSITTQVQESRSSISRPQQASPAPSDPRATRLSIRNACWLFSLWSRSDIQQRFPCAEPSQNMTGVHGNNLSADVSSFWRFLSIFKKQLRSAFNMLPWFKDKWLK